MRYPGGKEKCFQHIINVLPPHSVYIEPFLGAGAVLRHKRPAQITIAVDRDPQVIQHWLSERPSLARYVEADALDYLATQDFRGDEVVYCDPPYLPSTRRRDKVYPYDLTEKDHIRLLSILASLPCRILISGYDSRLYREHLQGWTIKTYFAKAHDRRREEKLWFNFPEPDQLHDGRFWGANFRQREVVKRRLQRLKRRIANLDPRERHELLLSFSSEIEMR